MTTALSALLGRRDAAVDSHSRRSARSRRRRASRARWDANYFAAALRFEELEPRMLMSVLPALSGGHVTFTVDGEGTDNFADVYIRTTDAGILEWSTSGADGTWSQDLDDNQSGVNILTLPGNADVRVTVKLDGFDQTGQLFTNLFSSPPSTLFVDNLYTGGANLTLEALSVKVRPDAVVSTRNLGTLDSNTDHDADASVGNSGKLKIDAPVIKVQDGASLLAHADGMNLAGDIVLNARGSLDDITSALVTLPILPNVTITQATIELTNPTIKGALVQFAATSDSADLFDDTGAQEDIGESMSESLADLIGSLSFIGGVAISEATAKVTISGGTVDASDRVELTSDALTDADVRTISSIIAVSYGHVIPTARVNILDGAAITSAGDVKIESSAFAEMSVAAAQSLFGLTTYVEQTNLIFAAGYSDVTAETQLGNDASINAGGNVNLHSHTRRDLNVSASASALADGKLAVAMAINVGYNTVEAKVDGDVTAGGDVLVRADTNTKANEVGATSGVGTDYITARFQGANNAIGSAVGLPGAILSGLLGNNNTSGALESSNQPWGFSGSLGIGIHFNEGAARIGDGATVSAGGDVAVEADIEEFPQHLARAKVNSSSGGAPWLADKLSGGTLNRTAANTRDNSTAIAISVGAYETTAKAYIGEGATVDAGGDVNVNAKSRVPYDIQVDNFAGAADLLDYINGNLGIQNGFFTGWTQAAASGKENAYGGNFNAMGIKNVAKAFIDNDAQVTAGDQVSVVAKGVISTVDFAGSLLGDVAASGRGVGGSVLANVPIIISEATIRDGAIVQAGAVLVHADSRGRSIAIGNQGGDADSFTVNGVLTWQWADNRTVAKIDDGAQVTTTASSLVIERDFGFASGADNLLLSPIRTFDPFEEYNDFGNKRVADFGDSIYLPYDHGLETGDAVIYDAGGGSPIDGLTDGNVYYVINGPGFTGGRIQLASNLADATAGTEIAISLTGTTGASHSLYETFDPAVTVSAASDTINLGYEHRLIDGQPVLYRSGDNDPSSDTTSIGGLDDDNIYYASVVDATTIRLHTSQQDAYDGVSAIDLDLTSTSGSAHSLTARYDRTYSDGFDPSAAVDDGGDTIDFGRNHGFSDGEEVTYTSGGTAIDGLTDGATYFASVIDATTVQLEDSSGNVIDIAWSGGAGESHEIAPVLNGVRYDNLLESLDTDGDGKITTNDDNVVEVRDKDYTLDYSLEVIAEDTSQIYSGAGAVTIGRASGVGLSLVNHFINRQTKAIIGNETQLLGSGSFAPGTGVDSAGRINLGQPHGLTDGDTVGYVSGGDFTIGGLLDGQTYIVGNSDAYSFELGRTAAEFGSTVTPSSSTVDAATDAIDLGYAHGFQSGDPVRYDAGGGAAIDGLTDGETYYVIPIDSTHIALATAERDALQQEKDVFNPHLFVDGAADEINFPYAHGLSDGQAVIYSDGGGAAIGGLTDGNVYYVTLVDDSTIQLATSSGGAAINLDPTAAQGETHSLQPGFAAASAVDDATDVIDLGYAHGLITGQRVRYDAHSGTPIVSANSDGVYSAIVISDTEIALASTQQDAFKARSWLLDSETHVNYDDDTIELFANHNFTDGDEIIFTYAGIGTPISTQLVDGDTYVIRTVPGEPTLIQLEDTSGTLIDLDEPAATDLFFIEGKTRLDLDPSGSAASEVQFIEPNQRIDLDASAATGSSHTFRLALDPTTANQPTHAIGKVFDPATAVDVDVNTIDLGYAHGLTTGQQVVYSDGRGESIGGLGHGNIYYAVVVDSTTIQLAKTYDDAVAPAAKAIDLDLDTTRGASHAIGPAMRTRSVVDSSAATIDFGVVHGFETGDEVVYRSGGGASLQDADTATGLTDGGSYYIIVIDDTTVQLAASQSDALSGTAIAIDGSMATGANHSLDDPDSGTGFIDTAGDVAIKAANAGKVVSVSLAAALATDYPWGASRSGISKEETKEVQQNNKPEHGIAISGDVAITVINDHTRAYIRDAEVTSGRDVRLLARDSTDIFVFTGAMTLSTVPDFAGKSATYEVTGVAGSLAVNVIVSDVDAFIETSDVEAAGDVIVAARSVEEMGGVAISLASIAKGQGIAGSVVTNTLVSTTSAAIRDSADITAAGDVIVKSSQENQLVASAGGLGLSFGGKEGSSATGVGLGIAVNTVSSGRGTVAEIVDADVSAGGDVEVLADTESKVYSVGMGFASASSDLTNVLAIGASLAINAVDTTTRASNRRKKSAGIIADGDIIIEAQDDTEILAITGAGAFASTKQSAKAGALAIGINIIHNDVEAVIEDGLVHSLGGDVWVDAHSEPQIQAFSIAGAAADGMVVTGSFTINSTNNTTEAHLAGVTSVVADGSVIVTADDQLNIITVAGAGGISETVNSTDATVFGVANSTVITSNKVKAHIGGDTTVQANANQPAVDALSGTIDDSGDPETTLETGVIVTAVSYDRVVTIAASGSVSESGNAIAGSATVTEMDETTHAWIDSESTINPLNSGASTNQNVTVRAAEKTDLIGAAGAAVLALSMNGVGAGVDVAVVNKDTQAWIDSAAQVSALGNVVVEARSREKAISVSGAGSAGSEAAIAGGVGVSVYDVTTKAFIAGANVDAGLGGAVVSADGSVKVEADESLQMDMGVGSLAVGELSIGGSVGVPVVIKTTEAFIGDGATVDARALRTGIDVLDGTFTVSHRDDTNDGSGEISSVDLDNADADDTDLLLDRDATPVTVLDFTGVAVSAVNRDDVELYGVGLGLSDTTAVEIGVNVHTLDATTKAYIADNAQVNQDRFGAGADQAVLVAAGSDMFHFGVSGVLSAAAGDGDAVAITPGVDIATATMTTKAFIGQSAAVDASADITVAAHANEDILAVAASMGGAFSGGELAIAGAASVAVIHVDNTTFAYIDENAVVHAGGNVAIRAEDTSDVDIIAGGIGLAVSAQGAGAIGAGIGVNTIQKDTRAWIGAGAIVDGEGNSTDMTVLNGAFDDSGNFGALTDARGVAVIASSEEQVFMVGAAGSIALAAYSAALAGAVNVETINSDTQAFIESGAQVNKNSVSPNANQDVTVVALNDVSVKSYVGSVGGSALGGLFGAFDVGVVRNDTTAYIAGDVAAARDVRVHALADRRIRSRVLSVGVGAIPLNGSVAVWRLSGNLNSTYTADSGSGNTVGSYAEDQSAVKLSGKLAYNTDPQAHSGNSDRVQQRTSEIALLTESDSDLDTVLESDIPAGTTAFIGDGATVDAGGDVDVTARDRVDADLDIGGVAAGLASVGVTVGQFTSGADVSAFIGVGAIVDSDNAINVIAQSTVTNAKLQGLAASGGLLLSGVGTDLSIDIKPDVSAYTLSQADLTAGGDVTIAADAAAHAKGDALGVNMSVGAAGGATLVDARVRPSVTANLGGQNDLTASNATIRATQSMVDGHDETAAAEGFSVSGGLIGGIGTDILARNGGTTDAHIGASSTLEVTGDVTIAADTTTRQRAEAKSGSVGVVSLGTSHAEARSNTTTTAYIATGVDLNADSLSITATGDDDHEVLAATSEIAFIGIGISPGGAAADAEVSATSTTEAYIAGAQGGNLIDVGDLDIKADHLVGLGGLAQNFSVSLLGGMTGSTFHADINPDVSTRIGATAKVQAQDLFMDSANRAVGRQTTVYSASGGLLAAGGASLGEITVHNNTTATVNNGAVVTVIADPAAPDAPGAIVIRAHNEGEFTNEASVNTGSAFPFTSSKSLIDLTDYDAIVDIGKSTLTSAGQITLSTWSEANVASYASAMVGGIAGKPEATGRSKVDSVNRVTLEPGASLSAEDDVNLLAGISRTPRSTDSRFPSTNNFLMQADAYTTADTANGAAKAKGVVDITQTNAVEVKSSLLNGNAKVTSVQDVILDTTGGFAVAAVDEQERWGTARKYGSGDITNQAFNTVTVDGTIEVGTRNQQILTIDTDGTILQQSEGVGATTGVVGTLDASIKDRIDELVDLLIEYGGTPDADIYLAEIEFWLTAIEDLGGEATYDPVEGLVITKEIETHFIDVDNVTAQSGDIIVYGDALVGDGTLIAPGDTLIQITNNSAESLRLADLTIPESAGGRVFFNLQRVLDNDAINDANDATVTGDSAGFTLDIAAEDAEPEIIIENIPHGGQISSAQVVLEGAISNISGTVTIDGGNGSVLAFGSIQAGTLNIDSGGDFVLTDTDWFHVSGLPRELYESYALANEAAQDDVSIPSAAITGSEATIAAGNVFISARYLNINGTIRSGLPTHTLTIHDTSTQTLAADLAAFDTDYAANGTQYHDLPSKYVTGDVIVRYDAAAQRLEIAEAIEVRGGYMELAGNILNTGGGKLEVVDGYGTIDITNKTEYDLVVSDINAGEGADDVTGIEGRIRITDTSRRVDDSRGLKVNLQTLITRVGDTITVLDNSTVDASNNPTHLVTTTGRETEYATKPDQRYVWTTAQSFLERRQWTLLNQSQQKTIPQVQAEGDLTVVSRPDEPTPLLDGEFVMQLAGPVYTYDYTEHFVSSYGLLEITKTIHRTCTPLGCSRDSTDYDHILTIDGGNKEISTHSVRADYPVDIEFIGDDEGAVTIRSLGSVIVAGTVSARGGEVKIVAGKAGGATLASGTATIEVESAAALIEAGRISLSAQAGIGDVTPIGIAMTDVMTPALSAITTTGDISITGRSGDVTVLSVETVGGDVTLTSDIGDIVSSSSASRVLGQNITLTANGDIGDASLPLIIDSGPADGDVVNALAGGDLSIREATGDLALERAESKSGDVRIEVPGGSLIDVNNTDEKLDTDARAELIALWERIGLIGDGAAQAAADAVAAYKAQRAAEYDFYWRLRGLTEIRDNSGAVVGYTADPYDAGFTYALPETLRHAYLTAGFTTDQIADLEASYTASYHDLNNVFGVGGTYDTVNDPVNGADDFDPTTYDPAFTYETTDAEVSQLTDRLNWTVDELLFGLPTAVVEPTSDTETLTETANIVGHNVDIIAGQSVGRDAPTIQTIIVPGGDVTALADEDIKIALLAAEVDDIALYSWTDANGNGTPENSELSAWLTDADDSGIADGDTNGNGLVDVGEFDVILLAQRQDLDIDADGVVNITAANEVFLGSESALRVGLIESTGDKDVRIKVDGNVTVGVSGTSANIVGQNFIIESGGGSIGAQVRPLRLDLTGSLVARSGDDVYIEGIGQLAVATIFADDAVTLVGPSLTTGPGVADVNDIGNLAPTNIAAASLTFNVDSVGTADNPLEIELEAGGALGGTVLKDLFIVSASDLTLDGLTSLTGDLNVTVAGDAQLGLVRAWQGDLSLTASGAILDDNGDGLNIQTVTTTLTASDIGASGDAIEVIDGAARVLETTGDQFVVSAAAPTGAFLAGATKNVDGDHLYQLGDVDLDGDLDLLSTSEFGSAIYLNDGTGTFGDAILSHSAMGPISWGDLDGDGDLDLFEPGWGGSNVTGRIYLNQGGDQAGVAGDFADSGQTLTYPITNLNFVQPAFGDMDGDGDLDALVLDFNRERMYVWINAGGGVFQVRREVLMVDLLGQVGRINDRASARLADVDGDHTLDAILTTQDGALVLTGNGDGTFADSGQRLGAGDWQDVAVIDLDSDGDVDMVSAAATGVHLWLNSGSGAFTDAGLVTSAATTGVAVADLDYDGAPDLFLSRSGAPSTVMINDGSASFTSTGQAIGVGGAKVALGDLDGDSAIDAYVLDERVWTNEVAPRPVSGQSFDVAELASPGVAIGVVNTLSGGGALVFAIDAGNDAGTFALDASTGELTVAAPLPAVADGQTNDLTLTIRVTDGNGLTNAGDVIVRIVDLASAPDVPAQDLFIAENSAASTIVGAVTTDDIESDLGDVASGFRIVGGSGAGLFAINADTGVVTFTGGALDYETTSSYTLLVDAVDLDGNRGPGSPAGEVTVHVTDVNEAPVVPAVVDVTFYENRDVDELLATITATDSENDTLTYALTDPSFAVRVDPDTGEVFVANPGVFDIAGNYAESFDVTDEHGLTSTTIIRFHALPYDDTPSLADVTLPIPEHGSADTFVGVLAAVDADVANGDSLTYQIISVKRNIFGGGVDNSPPSIFTLDPVTGVLRVDASGVDAAQTVSFELTVRVTDEEFLSDTAVVTALVVDTNESPVMDASSYAFTFPENRLTGGAVGAVSASDPDAGDTLTYSLVSATGFGAAMYEVDAATGDIRVRDGALIDYENLSARSVVLTIAATDEGGLADTATVQLDLTDLHVAPNDRFSGVNVSEAAPVDTRVFTLFSLLYDSEANAGDRLTFEIVGGTSPDAFEIRPIAGSINFGVYAIDTAALDFETQPHVLELFITVTDTEGQSALATLNFTLLDVDEPANITDGQSFNVSESLATGGNVGAVDGVFDAGDVFEIIAGNDGTFAIDAATGDITVADSSLLDYERVTDYSLTIRVTSASNVDESVVAVHVDDVDESDLAISKSASATAYVLEGDDVTYTIVVTNPGDADAVGATVTDYLNGLTNVQLVDVQTTGGATTSLAAGALLNGLIDTIDIPVGASVTYTVVGTVSVRGADRPLAGDALLTSRASVAAPFVDVAPANNGSAGVGLVVGQSPGVGMTQFRDSGQVIGSGVYTDVVLGDVDGDGDLDAFVSRFLGDQLWLNDGSGVFDTVVSFSFSSDALALADLDDDGDLDAVIGLRNAGDLVLLNDGAAHFTDSGQSLLAERTGDLSPLPSTLGYTLADLDGDGDTDIYAYTADGNEHVVWLNDGAAQFTQKPLDRNVYASPSAQAGAGGGGDFDHDGDVDTVAPWAGSLTALSFNDGSGAFNVTQVLDTGGANSHSAVADLNGDGWLDVIAGRNAGIDRVLLNDGAGQLVFTANLGFAQTISSELGDLDGDGDLDVVTIAGNGQHRVWINDGSGSFTEQPVDAELTALTGVGGAAMGDLDGDGDLDLFLAGSGSNRVWLGHTGPKVTLVAPIETIEDEAVAVAGVAAVDPDSAVISAVVSVDPAAGALTYGATTGYLFNLTGSPAEVSAALDTFIFKPALNVAGEVVFTVMVDDGIDTFARDIPVLVDKVNDAPTVNVPTGVTTLEDTPVAPTVTISDVESDPLTLTISTASGVLTLGATTAPVVTATGTPAELNALLATMVFTPDKNFDQDASVRVQLVDGEHTVTRTFIINVQPVNDAPELQRPPTGFVSLGFKTDEDTTTTVPGISVFDADGDLLTVTISTDVGSVTFGGETGASVTQVGGAKQLSTLLAKLTYTPQVNYIGNATITLVADDGLASDTETVTIIVLDDGIADVNQPATVELAPSVSELPEDVDTTSRIEVATIVVTDDALGTNVLSLAGADAALFEIDGSTLYLRAGAVLHDETNPALDVTVQVDDIDPAIGFSPDDSASMSITVLDGNDAPTIADQMFTLPENSVSGSLVGTVVADDVDAGDALVYMIVTGNDSGAFLLDPTTGAITVADAALLDYETSPQRTLTVAVTDQSGAGLTAQADVSITLTDVNEAPTADAGGPYATTEGGGIVLSGATASDPEQDGATLTYQWDLDGDGIYGEPASDYGDETAASPLFDAGNIDGDQTLTIRLRVVDDQGLVSETSTTTVVVANVAPTLTVTGAPAPGVPLYLLDSVDITATLTDPGVADTHTVTVDWGDGIIEPAPYNPATGEIPASHAYTAAGDYTVHLTAVDDDGGSDAVDIAVTVLTTNDAIDDLIDQVENTGLSDKDAAKLTQSLTKALDNLAGSKPKPAKAENEINKYLKELDKSLSKGKLTLAEYESLYAAGELILQAITQGV